MDIRKIESKTINKVVVELANRKFIYQIIKEEETNAV